MALRLALLALAVNQALDMVRVAAEAAERGQMAAGPSQGLAVKAMLNLFINTKKYSCNTNIFLFDQIFLIC
jgi:hypothetical protein